MQRHITRGYMNNNDFALESFKNIQDLVKFTDQKSGAILLVTGLNLTAFIETAKDLTFILSDMSITNVLIFIFGTVTILLLIYTIYLSINGVLRPRIAIHYSNSGEVSLLYYQHIAMLTDKNELFLKMLNLTDDLILKNISDQIYEVAKILQNKTGELIKSINFLYYSIVSLLIFIFISRL